MTIVEQRPDDGWEVGWLQGQHYTAIIPARDLTNCTGHTANVHITHQADLMTLKKWSILMDIQILINYP